MRLRFIPTWAALALLWMVSGARAQPNAATDAQNVTTRSIDGSYHTSAFPSTCTVNSAAYTTAGDCAFYTALYAAQTTGLNQVLIVDQGETDTCAGWVHPVLSNNATLSLIGAAGFAGSWDINVQSGTPVVHLKQTCSIGANAVITYQAGAGISGSNGPTATIKGIYIDANSNAGACGDFLRLSRSTIEDDVCVNATGSHGFRFGNSSATGETGWVYETELKNLTVYPPAVLGGGASGKVTIAKGSATGYALSTHGGSFTSSASAYSVLFTGWGIGVSQPNGPSPCTTVPTAHVATISGGQVTAIAFDTNGSGCDANNTYFDVIPKATMDRAFWFDRYSDSIATNLVSNGPVNTSSFYIDGNSGGFTLKTPHGYNNALVMIKILGSIVEVDSPLCDTPLQACIVNFGYGNHIHGGYRLHVAYQPGSGDFWDSRMASEYGNVWGPISGCAAATAESGYNTFGSPTGPLSISGFSPSNASRLSINNVESCSPSSFNGGLPVPINAIPSPASTGGMLKFVTNITGPGQADCTAIAGAADEGGFPGYDPATGLVTFPADAYQNGGSLTCTLSSGTTVSRIFPSTGTSPQTFDIGTILSAASTGTQKFYSNIAIGANTILPTTLTGDHGTGVKVQLSDGAGTSGNLAKYAADGSVTDGPSVNSLATASSPTANHAACIKSAGPPVLVGYCSTVVASDGTCTCN